MKRKIIFIVLILILAGFLALAYVNRVLLPGKVSSLLIKGIEDTTGAKVSLESLKFDIFKGIVANNFSLSDKGKALIRVKEVSFNFFVLPILKKKIIIPHIKIKSPVIFLERTTDNKFNLSRLFFGNKSRRKTGFNLLVYKASVEDCSIRFQDNTLEPVFNKKIEHINAETSFSFPDKIKFDLVAGQPDIKASGIFDLARKQLTAKASIAKLFLPEFSRYFRRTGFSINNGLLDGSMDFILKDSLLSVDCKAAGRGVHLAKDKISVESSADLTARISYNLKDNKLDYSIAADFTDSNICGLKIAGDISKINGRIDLDNNGIHGEKLKANIWGVEVEAGLKLADFKSPSLEIGLLADLGLDVARKLLAEKLKFVIPAELKGASSLYLKLEFNNSFNLIGLLNIKNAMVKFERVTSPFREISGKLEFTKEHLKWSGLNFKYLDTLYQSEGILYSFKEPKISFRISADDLFLQSEFSIQDKNISIAQCSGNYFDSLFTVKGNVVPEAAGTFKADLDAELKLDLKNLKGFLKKHSKELERIKPVGILEARFNLKGDPGNLRTCLINGKVASNSLSLYGYEAEELVLTYNQQDGIINIPQMHLSLYGGKAEGNAKMDLNTIDLLSWLSLDLKDIKLEDLPSSGQAREKEIAGKLGGHIESDGPFKNLPLLNGTGSLSVTQGKLWKFSLFKGLGSLVFAKDFANIVFDKASCNFSIRDQFVSTEKLELKSMLVNLVGPFKIGFDGSLDGMFNVQVFDEIVPLAGAFQDITTAIAGQAGRFAAVKISGTLKEPKLTFKSLTTDILKMFKGFLLRNPDGK